MSIERIKLVNPNTKGEGDMFFEKQMLKKRTQFHEQVHAAFVLETSLNNFGNISEDQMSWLGSAYPNSEIELGNDQGANYYSIKPIL